MATVDAISEEVYDAMCRASELTQATQVVSPFVSYLRSSKDLGSGTPSFVEVSMDDLDFMEREIIARETFVTEEEKEVRKYKQDPSSSDD